MDDVTIGMFALLALFLGGVVAFRLRDRANERRRFLERCKLTCIGGSERGTCPCPSPAHCIEKRVHPDRFSFYRIEAIRRQDEEFAKMIRDPKESPDRIRALARQMNGKR